MAPGRIPGMSEGRIPGDVVEAGGCGIGCGADAGCGPAGGCSAAGATGTAGMDGLLMRIGSLTGGAGGGVAVRARGIVGMLSRPVSMLISPYSSSSIAAVGSDAAARPGAAAGG